MLGIEYLFAALSVIKHLQDYITYNIPERSLTEQPLTWEETLSNIDHLANDEHNEHAITILITDYFHDQPAKALKVARCESGLNPLAYNRSGPYIGIYQIESGSSDARENVAHARRMFERRGWQPWPYCGRL